jgi:hypothetical protein
MDIAVLKKEAKSKKTLATRLLELARNADPTVQYAVSANPNAPLAALEYLSGHGKWTILKAVALNPNVSEAILEPVIRDLYANMNPEEFHNAGWTVFDSSDLNLETTVCLILEKNKI